MWFALEDGRMLNADLVTDVVFREMGHHSGMAIPYAAGVALSGESKAVYDFFKTLQAGPHFYTPPEPTPEPSDNQSPPSVQPGV